MGVSRSSDNEVEAVSIEHIPAIYSNEATITIVDNVYSQLKTNFGIPHPPINISVTHTDIRDGVGFLFKAKPYPDDIGVTSIVIQMNNDDDTDFVTVAQISPNKGWATYTNDNLTLDHTYYFRFYAETQYKRSGSSSIQYFLNSSSYLLPPPSGIYVQGQNPNLTTFEGKDVNIVWNPVGSDSHTRSLVAGYNIEIYDSSDNLLRTAFETSNGYLYSYSMNLSDSVSGVAEGDLLFVIRTVMVNSKESNSSSALHITNGTPSAPTGLTSVTWMEAGKFTWIPATENDFSHYLLRTKVESDAWSDWFEYNSSEYFRSLTNTEVTDHTSEAMIYFEITAVDVFRNESTASSTNVTTSGLNIQSSDINDFEITASKIFTKIPILESDSWTNNSPSAGYVAWNRHTIYCNGAGYTIAAGNTNLKYIYWVNGATSYTASNTNPTLTDDDFIIAVNIDGAHDLAWNAIANEIIGSAYIQKLAVNDQHVGSLSADKIDTGTLSGILIIGNTIKTAASGRSVIITSDGITLHVTSSVGKYSTFKYGDGTKYGSGVVAYIHHVSQTVPFYISAEQAVADFHFFNRVSNPTGAAEIGDVCIVNGNMKRCTGAGTPGTWTSTATIV